MGVRGGGIRVVHHRQDARIGTADPVVGSRVRGDSLQRPVQRLLEISSGQGAVLLGAPETEHPGRFTKDTATERFCRDALAVHASLFRLWHKFRSGLIDRPQLLNRSIRLQRRLFVLAEANLDSPDHQVPESGAGCLNTPGGCSPSSSTRAWNPPTTAPNVLCEPACNGARSASEIDSGWRTGYRPSSNSWPNLPPAPTQPASISGQRHLQPSPAPDRPFSDAQR